MKMTTNSKNWGLYHGIGAVCVAHYYIPEYQRGHYADGIWVPHNENITRSKEKILWVIDDGIHSLKLSDGGEEFITYTPGIEIAGIRIQNLEKRKVEGFMDFEYVVSYEELPPEPIHCICNDEWI